MSYHAHFTKQPPCMLFVSTCGSYGNERRCWRGRECVGQGWHTSRAGVSPTSMKYRVSNLISLFSEFKVSKFGMSSKRNMV